MDNLLKTIFSSATVIMLAGASAAQAEWYIGADTIQNQAIPHLDSLALDSLQTYRNDDHSNGVSLFGGFKTKDNFSLQLEYQDDLSFGIDDMFAGSSLWFPEATADNFESNAVFLSGTHSYQINENGFFYMKGGLFNWEVDSNYYESHANYLGQSSGTDLFYGLGANYDLNARFAVSAEWERYEMEKSDIDYLSTKLKFKF